MDSKIHPDNASDLAFLHARLTKDLTGFQRAAIMRTLVELNVIDIIASGKRSCDLLSQTLNVDLSALKRLLNAAASLKLLRQETGGDFSVTELGAFLSPSHPMSVAPYARLSLDQYWLPWRDLTQSIRDGQTVFERVHGCSPWEYRNLHPEQGALFDSWQKAESSQALRDIMGVWDLSAFEVVADIGGGIGTLLEASLSRWTRLQGILFEQVQTLAKMPPFQNPDVEKRLTKLAGDFFDDIPIKADCWVLKSVLHNWDDAHAQQILMQCAKAMGLHARLFIVERVLRDDLSPNAFMVDLHMLMVTGGRERNMAQYQQLASKAGLSVMGLTPTAGDFSLIELTRQ